MNFGIVSSVPDVKFVTTISSQESAHAGSTPAMTAVLIDGQVMYRNVCHPSAPRSIDASTWELPVRRRRASTLLYTTTMQKVVCPRMIVRTPNGMGRTELLNVVLSAMPVKIPGNAIGRTSTNDTVFRPKNW